MNSHCDHMDTSLWDQRVDRVFIFCYKVKETTNSSAYFKQKHWLFSII